MSRTPATSARDESARRIRTLVAEGELESALEQLRDLALLGPRDLGDEAFVLSGRLARLNRQSRKGTITSEAAGVERNRIAFAIPSPLDDLVKKLPPDAGLVAVLLVAVLAGDKVFGKGHRDPARGTRSFTVSRWGRKWVMLTVSFRFPFTQRRLRQGPRAVFSRRDLLFLPTGLQFDHPSKIRSQPTRTDRYRRPIVHEG
jgi:hypothetical protein